MDIDFPFDWVVRVGNDHATAGRLKLPFVRLPVDFHLILHGIPFIAHNYSEQHARLDGILQKLERELVLLIELPELVGKGVEVLDVLEIADLLNGHFDSSLCILNK